MATVCSCILRRVNGGFVNLVNFLGPGDRQFGKKTNFKSLEFNKNFRYLVSCSCSQGTTALFFNNFLTSTSVTICVQ